MSNRITWALLGAALTMGTTACSDKGDDSGDSSDGGSTTDGGSADGGSSDGGSSDGGSSDGGSSDGGSSDDGSVLRRTTGGLRLVKFEMRRTMGSE